MNPLFREMFTLEACYKYALRTKDDQLKERTRIALLKIYYEVIRDYSGMNIYLNVEAAA